MIDDIERLDFAVGCDRRVGGGWRGLLERARQIYERTGIASRRSTARDPAALRSSPVNPRWGGDIPASEMRLRWLSIRFEAQERRHAAEQLEVGHPGQLAAWQRYEKAAEIEGIFRRAYEAARDGEAAESRVDGR